jgi:hypothetical protein
MHNNIWKNAKVKIWLKKIVLTLILTQLLGNICFSQELSINIVGKPTVIFDQKTDACDNSDLPDSPMRAFRNQKDQMVAFAPNFNNRALIPIRCGETVKFDLVPPTVAIRKSLMIVRGCRPFIRKMESTYSPWPLPVLFHTGMELHAWVAMHELDVGQTELWHLSQPTVVKNFPTLERPHIILFSRPVRNMMKESQILLAS